ncbi:MAG: M67 family metallopeptidase [Candidatus Bathyarchaeia archaeon]
MVLILKEVDYEKIVAHANQVFPIEACGILVGKKDGENKVVEKVYPTRNILNSSSRYQVDPEEQLRIFMKAEEEAREVLGFYHSHPYWSAYFSEIDRELALYEKLSYLVYSVPEKKLKAFVKKGKLIEEEAIRIV